MRFEVFMALRHIRSRRRQTLLSVAAIALAIAIAVVAQAELNGFTQELLKITVEDMPHVSVEPREGDTHIFLYRGLINEVEGVEGVEGVAPFLAGQATLAHKDNVENAILGGVDPERAPRVSRIEEQILEGDLSDLEQGDTLLLGDDLAGNLDVVVGDTVAASFPGASPRNLRVVGLVDTRTSLDEEIAYTSLETAQRFYEVTAVSELQVRLDDFWEAEDMAEVIEARTGYPARGWTETSPEIMQTIALETLGNQVTLGLILIIASLGIVSTLVLSVMEKTRDIGMLMAMGSTPRQIMTIYILESGLLGLLGAIAGSILGAAIAISLSDVTIEVPEGLFPISFIPIVLRPIDILVFTILAFALNLVAGLLPARRAAKLNPVEAIRGE